MANYVEGDWKDFNFKMIQPEDVDRVLEHLRNIYCNDEPFSRYIGDSDSKRLDYENITKLFIKEGLSFFVEHTASKKVAGVRITGISTKGDKSEEFESMLVNSESIDLFYNIIELQDRVNVYEKYSVNRVADFLLLSVDREFRGQGLAQEIYRRSFQLLKANGLKAAVVTFSGPISQNIGTKMGFQELARKSFKEFLKSDGQKLFPLAGEDEVATYSVILL